MNMSLPVNSQIILASSSPRRRDLLQAAGLSFEVMVSPAEEIHDANIPLQQLCEGNARLKAVAVAGDHPDALVIGADTLVYIDQTPLGKPRDREQARGMLRQLSGRISEVCTGVCIAHGKISHCFHAVTEVMFRELSDEMIENYMSMVEVMDKAGAYAVQEHGDLIIEEVRGDYDNVVGLPVDQLLVELRSWRE